MGVRDWTLLEYSEFKGVKMTFYGIFPYFLFEFTDILLFRYFDTQITEYEPDLILPLNLQRLCRWLATMCEQMGFKNRKQNTCRGRQSQIYLQRESYS